MDSRTTRPLIGLTCYAANDQGRVNLPVEYVAAISRAGGMPVLIPPEQPDPEGLLDRIDGFLLAGGGDLHPASYGEEEHETLYGLSRERDRVELELARCLLERRAPLLAICRGLQVVNVALGGTLHPHLPDVVGEIVLHRAPPHEPISHPIRIEPDSDLAERILETEIEPMSWHHQGICDLAPGLRPVAWAADEIIEAVEREGHPGLMGVQWHPELTAEKDPTQQRLFDWFVDMVRGSSEQSGYDREGR